MKLKVITGSTCEALEAAADEFLANAGVTVVSKHVDAARVFVFYESLEDQGIREATMLHDEQERLRSLCSIACDLRVDTIYAALHNQKQRELFLLSKGIGAHDASDLIELMKPEMQAVVEWGRK